MEFLHSHQNKLTQAIIQEDWSAVRSICETESHLINTSDEIGWTPLMFGVAMGAQDDVMLIMIENATAENITHKDADGETIIHNLARNAYASALKRALQTTTTKINQGDSSGYTPLHYCLDAPHSYNMQREITVCLLTYGASVSIKTKDGKTPLDLYNDNICGKYEETTRVKKKKELRKLLEELSVPEEILARGEEAVKAFKDAIQNGEITVVNSRIMFLGNEGTGKTSCINAMLGKGFNENEPPTDGIVTTTVFQTVGEDCSKWEEQKNVDECELTKQIREHAIAANVAKKLTESQQNASTSAPLSTCDPGRTSSLSSITTSMEKLEKATNMNERVPWWKRGNLKKVFTWNFKLISRKPQVFQDAGAVSINQPVRSHANRLEKKLPDGIHKKLVDKLADKSPGSSNVGPSEVTCIWDYAGQLTYYITHRFYLTDGSSYGVVFSLLDDLDALAKPRYFQKGPFEMTNLEMNLFWIRSIYEHAVLPHGTEKRNLISGMIASPPISLIGTHLDQLQGSDADKQILIKGIFDRIFEEIKGTPYERHVDREMYAVDNTATCDKGIEKLKKNVGGYMKAMARIVPIKWVDFQTKVQEVGKTTVRMPLDEITKIAVGCGISKENVIHVLNYLNDLGIILYSASTKKLRNTVITNIHMLIGIFMKIITVVKPDDHDKDVPVMMQCWRKLDEEGILEEELLRFLWRNDFPAGKDCDVIFEDFLELMKTFGLLFEKGSQEGSRVFIVPSRMNVKTDNLEVKKDEEQTVSIYVTPKHFLPDAVYSVLVVKFLELCQDKTGSGEPKLFQNQAEIGFDNLHYMRLGVVCIKNKRSLKLEITRRTEIDEYHKQKPASMPQAIVCMEILPVLKLHLDDLYPSKCGVRYTLNILCPVCSVGSNQDHHFQSLDDCLKYDYIPCGTNTMSTARIQSLFQADLSFSKEIRNFYALQALTTDQGIKQMRNYFMKEGQVKCKHDVGNFLLRQRQNGVIKDADFGEQATKIFTADADIDTFDITILMYLIQHCFSPKGDTSWNNPPDDKDTSELANLRRIQLYKGTILDCSHSNRVTDVEFDIQWKKLTTIFGGVGVPDEDIQKYRKQYVEGSVRGFDEEIKNFQAISSVIVDLGTETMRNYFLKINELQKNDVGTFLSNQTVQESLKKVRMFPDQKVKLSNADIDRFDITLLMLLIRTCCNIPASFWTNPDELTSLIHIHQYRNSLLAHTPNSRMSTKDFEIEWQKVRAMLLGAGASSNEINKYNALRFTN